MNDKRQTTDTDEELIDILTAISVVSKRLARNLTKPTLVPESDKRPAMNTAKNDFMEENDYE